MYCSIAAGTAMQTITQTQQPSEEEVVTITIRVPRTQGRHIRVEAAKRDKTLNALIIDALDAMIGPAAEPEVADVR